MNDAAITWILLRGLARERRHWGQFPAAMRNAMPGIRIITLDLPGNGGLRTMQSPLVVAGMVEHCRTELSRHSVTPPYHLLAISMGGMVATEWAQRHPDEIDACVLINTSFGNFSPLHHRLRARAWPMMLQLLLPLTARRREEAVFCLTSNLRKPPGRLIDEWLVIRQSRPVTLSNALRQLMAATRFRPPASPPAATLILASDLDGLVDSRCSREIAHRWNCAFALHPTAGHDLPLDDGAWVVSEVCKWLAQPGDKHTSTGAASRPFLA